MLVHIVCWRYKAETDTKTRDEHITRLRALPDLIPDITSFDVGADILGLDRSFDTGLSARFPGRGALDHYTEHPDHRAVAELGRQIAEKVVSVDFFID